MLGALSVRVIQAPMAGGPSTPALARAVAGGGGLGILAAGYRTPQALADELDAMGDVPHGVNLFAPVPGPAAPGLVGAYAAELAPEAARRGVEVGPGRFDDDAFEAKAALVLERAPAVVSFAFGLPPAELVRALRERGSAVWMTVTSPREAQAAVALGVDALVAQGAEAGGHRGGAEIPTTQPLTTLALLQLLAAAEPTTPVVAAGGIATRAASRAALALGAGAVAAGTAFLGCPEAGTSAPHRAALASGRATTLTRAFSGRLARALENDLEREHGQHAPAAYPEVHHLTTPIRAAARAAGDPEALNLWAGQAHALVAHGRPAAEVVEALTP